MVARDVLDDVEEMLREVAALDACARPQDLEAIHGEIARRHLLMKIDLDDPGAAGMTRVPSGLRAGAPGRGAAVFASGGRCGQADADACARPRRCSSIASTRRRGRPGRRCAPGRGRGGGAAAYWVARCSENLGESERALREYDEFLALRPKDARW